MLCRDRRYNIWLIKFHAGRVVTSSPPPLPPPRLPYLLTLDLVDLFRLELTGVNERLGVSDPLRPYVANKGVRGVNDDLDVVIGT